MKRRSRNSAINIRKPKAPPLVWNADSVAYPRKFIFWIVLVPILVTTTQGYPKKKLVAKRTQMP